MTGNERRPHSISIDDPAYESGGQGVIVVTLAAALTTLTLILYTIYRFILKTGHQ